MKIEVDNDDGDGGDDDKYIFKEEGLDKVNWCIVDYCNEKFKL